MSDASLVRLAYKLHQAAHRDEAQMSTFGFSNEYLARFLAESNVFANMQTDEELSGYMMIATQNKNLIANNLRVQIRQHQVRIINLFGQNSAPDKMLGIETLSRQPQEELVRTGKRTHRVLTNFEAELASQCVLQGVINDFWGLVNAFDAAIDAQDEAIRNRDIAVDERVKAGNELYKNCVKIANAGKVIFESTGQAQYNDYVITETSPRKQQVSGTVKAETIVNVSVIIDNENDTVFVKNTGPENLKVYLSQNPTDEPPQNANEVQAGQLTNFTAKTLGFTDTARRLLLCNQSKTDVEYWVDVV